MHVFTESSNQEGIHPDSKKAKKTPMLDKDPLETKYNPHCSYS